MSLSLKRLIPVDVTWLNIPEEEKLWNAWRQEAVKRILETYQIHTLEGFVELDEIAGMYDVIVMAQVMEHLVFNPVNTFRKLAKLLRPGGRLFVSVPQEVKHYNVTHYSEMPFPSALAQDEIKRRMAINGYGHFHEYSYEEAMEVFRESGLECEVYQWTFPIHHFCLQTSK